MKNIGIYLLAMIFAINSIGCATTQTAVTESPAQPTEQDGNISNKESAMEPGHEVNVNPGENTTGDDIAKGILGAFLIFLLLTPWFFTPDINFN